ncbi:DNA polymerase IV [Alteromonadaceae bacterium BrNp21-10]|nr:DNA polymerase IV [Alteromonadaceae bacterium BrNp21-10]
MRKIIHVDMDCYFAAVEMRDNPAYRNVPMAIGGATDRRGVIATSNYIAREFGVRSAMPTSIALQKCPQLVLVPGRMEVYASISKQIRDIFQRYTDIIEPLSLDEAYLDVSDCLLFGGSATLIAQHICQSIYQETGLTASAGVAPCKFVAKIASDENKPNGICVVTPEEVDTFVRQLPLGKIPGVGKVTLEKLNRLGLYYCEDVRRYPFDKLLKAFGKFGPILWQRSQGIDDRQLNTERQRKSVGVETTLATDITSFEQCWQCIQTLIPKLEKRLQKVSPTFATQTQGVKLKFADFQLTTVELKRNQFDKRFFRSLLTEALTRQQQRGIRLVGVHVGLPHQSQIQQLELPLSA